MSADVQVSDGGNDETRQTLGRRRRKSAKARNRGRNRARSVPPALWGFSRGRLGEV
jgi:hypothetical protein